MLKMLENNFQVWKPICQFSEFDAQQKRAFPRHVVRGVWVRGERGMGCDDM